MIYRISDQLQEDLELEKKKLKDKENEFESAVDDLNKEIEDLKNKNADLTDHFGYKD
jgi:predicted  nucleic acid-binding Zn-ribbon protein